ncbi:MAG TPA: hypothetical protein PKE64_20330 [Anaerolineae bacterium]|nr:hypothetical protein [Anaerolineae bacterium]HMR66366.1 hypothetical protein [Anaerolineae bacterium]
MDEIKCIEFGNSASAGFYECADCGYQMPLEGIMLLPICPNLDKSAHAKKCWLVLEGEFEPTHLPEK